MKTSQKGTGRMVPVIMREAFRYPTVGPLQVRCRIFDQDSNFDLRTRIRRAETHTSATA